ncbi:MAG TPA: hypothetical protein VFH74_12205 [Gaiellales bacterium]|nr:hypothetical protein [Gaiellales bacterium]
MEYVAERRSPVPEVRRTSRRRQQGADTVGMNNVVEQLKELKARRGLIRAAEEGRITTLRCAMDECLCPEELGGRGYFEPVTPELSDWMPTNDHFPTLKCDGGKETPENSRLAHRLCNRVDYSNLIGRSCKKDMARVEAARVNALRRSA